MEVRASDEADDARAGLLGLPPVAVVPHDTPPYPIDRPGLRCSVGGRCGA